MNDEQLEKAKLLKDDIDKIEEIKSALIYHQDKDCPVVVNLKDILQKSLFFINNYEDIDYNPYKEIVSRLDKIIKAKEKEFKEL